VDGRLAYTATCDPADTMIVQTNQDQAEDFSKTRISRAIKASPELCSRLSPRAHDDNVLLKFFRSGMSLRFGWPSLSVASGKDIRVVLMTDVDNFTGDLSIDEAFGLFLKRTQTYMSAGVLVAESSPAMDYVDGKWRPPTSHHGPPAKGISALYNRGDRRRWYWPCPECKEHFQAAPGIDGFKLPPLPELIERVKKDDVLDLARRHALLHCDRCHVGLEQRWKRTMNKGGHWVGDGQVIHADGSITGDLVDSRTASFWLGGVAATYQSWLSLVERYLQAVRAFATTGDEKSLRTTTNVDQALPYLPMAARSEGDPTELEARAEDWDAGVVPEGVQVLTSQVDVQANRFVVLILGWGPSPSGGLERWIIDSFTLKSSRRSDGSGGWLALDPAKYLEDWERLVDKAIVRSYPTVDGREIPIRGTVIDWGGKSGTSSRALEFWRSVRKRRLHWRVRLGKGDGRLGIPVVSHTYPDARKRQDRKSGAVGDVPHLLMNVNRLKDTVSVNIARQERGPGFYHFGRWLPASFYEELTSESRSDKGWINPAKRRNEAMDLCAYGEALSLWLKLPAINWSKPPSWAVPRKVVEAESGREEDEVSEAPPAHDPPPPKRQNFTVRRRSGWIKRW
jgi:phage terminase large subunit GpA-like protein